MIEWIKNLFRDKKSKEILQWETNDSILEFLKKNLGADGSLKEAADTLPDEKKADDEIKFAPGLMDSMFGTDDSEESKVRVKKLTDLINKVSKTGEEQSQSDFYTAITEKDNVIGIIDQFLQKLVQMSLSIEPFLYNYAYSLATKSSNRNAVKFGIAILGLCQNKKAIEDIKILGLHDEFTVFSTVALSNLSDNLVQDLWQLAKHVDGWGKIQIVDRLVQMELTNEIKDWLVLEGYKNSIMYEYLALACAINGELNDKLQAETVGQDLFDAAGEIIIALINNGPTIGILGYNDANETIQNYIRLSKSIPLKIADFITLHRIKDYLEASPEENEIVKNWDENDLSNCLIDLNEVLRSKDWTSEVQVALNSSNNMDFWNGKQAAQKLEMDISTTLWNRLDKYPLDSTSWYDITTFLKPENPQKIVEKAISLIPLKEISTGPENSMGTGPDFQKHQSLDFIITFLGNHPNHGEEIILAGLKSPVIRNRIVTLRTLQSWTSSNWTEAIKKGLNRLLEIEPDADIKSDLVKLLKGEKIE